ncbi:MULTISPECIES: AAA family ATPase [unclassified Myroides]|uniref:AAA family ATPase n=1 Tax=unclassified Myroides TaxID=2642485 RepID=UPI003D2F81D3
MKKVKRAFNYEDISRKKFESIKIHEDWEAHLGSPQLGNSQWIVCGDSGHGKTSYLLQLAKMLCASYRVHYDTLEEGMKKSFKMALERSNIKSVKSKFIFSQETLEELTVRLDRPRQPKIVIIDSVQYFFRGCKVQDYFNFIEKFQNTTFIWVSAIRGNLPMGAVAEAIYYDCDIRVNVRKFEAVIEKNRFEAYGSYIIWEEGYQRSQTKLLLKG